ADLPYLHPFPTRRSSDLHWGYPPLYFFNKGQCRGMRIHLTLSFGLADAPMRLNCNSATEEGALPVPSLFPLERTPRYGQSPNIRSEEHTSELQSQSNLVC